MRVGDLLEWLAGAALVTGAYLATSLAWPAVLAAAVFLFYQAQCYAAYSIKWPMDKPLHVRLPRRKKRDQ